MENLSQRNRRFAFLTASFVPDLPRTRRRTHVTSGGSSARFSRANPRHRRWFFFFERGGSSRASAAATTIQSPRGDDDESDEPIRGRARSAQGTGMMMRGDVGRGFRAWGVRCGARARDRRRGLGFVRVPARARFFGTARTRKGCGLTETHASRARYRFDS